MIIWIGTTFLLISFVLITYGYAVPASQLFGRVYTRGRSRHKIVALTFDDGPNDPYTSQVLEILQLHSVKATFFATGKNVQLFPETARRIVAEGHILGNHSFSHNANHAVIPTGNRDIGLAQAAIYETVGVLPHLYRPPHGKKSPWEMWYLRSHGLVVTNWSSSTQELRVKTPALLAQRIVKKVRPGAIVLLHDGYGNDHHTHQADKSLTVRALPLIIEALTVKGYHFVTVPQLLHIPAYGVATEIVARMAQG